MYIQKRSLTFAVYFSKVTVCFIKFQFSGPGTDVLQGEYSNYLWQR